MIYTTLFHGKTRGINLHWICLVHDDVDDDGGGTSKSLELCRSSS